MSKTKLAKRWNFIPFRYSTENGLIDLIQIFATPLLTVQIHIFKQPDRVVYHDHPWSFVSLMLRGSYTERLWKDPYDFDSYVDVDRRLLSIHKMDSTTAHQIFETRNAVTLFFSGPWHRDGIRFYRKGLDFDMSGFADVYESQPNMVRMR